MQIQLPADQIKSALQLAATNFIAGESALGADAVAQLNTLVEEIYPLAIAETQSLITATNPAIAQQYLAVLQGTMTAKVAELGLAALESQKQQIAAGIATGIQILALVLKAAVVAAV